MPTETELKLTLSDDAPRRLLESETLRNAAAGPPRRERIVTTYWDTLDRALARRGLSLRVRRQGGKRLQTLKAQGDGGAAMERGEWEWPLDADEPDLELAAATPAADFARAALAPTLTTDVMRTARELRIADAVIEADIDEGELRAGDKREPIRELELELREGALGELYRLAVALYEETPFGIETQSKAQRGARLGFDERPQARKADPQRLPPDIPAAEAFRRIVAKTLGHVLANAAPARDRQAEGVHQLRVGVRRLRSALKLFAPLLTEPAAEAFDRKLQDLGHRIGEARDWSVFCDEQLSQVFAEGDRPDWGDLIGEAAKAKRDAAFARSAEIVAGSEFAALALSLAAWAEESGRRPRLVGDESLDQPIERLAPDLIGGLIRKARKRARRAEDGDAVALHGFRKALKKLRYGLEFLDGVHQAPAKLRKEIKKLLNRLGDLNDVVSAAPLAQSLASERVELAPAAAAFASRREAALGEAAPRLARRARRFRDRTR